MTVILRKKQEPTVGGPIREVDEIEIKPDGIDAVQVVPGAAMRPNRMPSDDANGPNVVAGTASNRIRRFSREAPVTDHFAGSDDKNKFVASAKRHPATAEVDTGTIGRELANKIVSAKGLRQQPEAALPRQVN